MKSPIIIHRLTVAVAAAIVTAIASTTHVEAQQTSNSMFDADTYWSGYWSWYDTEYAPGYRLRTRPPLVSQTPGYQGTYRQGSSPAISGAPDAGGDYDDYPAEFYVPGGASKFYDKPTPAQADRYIDLGRDSVTKDAAAPRTIRPRAGTAEDRERIPPDIDAPPPARSPADEVKAEVWY